MSTKMSASIYTEEEEEEISKVMAAYKAYKAAKAKGKPTEQLKPQKWKHGFETYERLDYQGKSYIYDLATKEYLGVYDANKNILDTSVPDIMGALGY